MQDLHQTLLASSLASLLSRTLCHPLDTIKIHTQFHDKPLKWNHAIISKLYRGLTPSLLFSVPGLSVYLAMYGVVKESLENRNKRSKMNGVLIHGVAGMSAEAVSNVFWAPMENIKNKLQIYQGTSGGSGSGINSSGSGKIRFKNTLDVVSTIYARQGLPGFFRGYLLGLGVFGPYSVIYFVVYEELKDVIAKRRKGEYTRFWEYLGCSAVAGAMGAVVSNGLDVVRTRVQGQIGSGSSSNSSSNNTRSRVSNVIQELRRQHGPVRWMFLGLQYRVLFTIPNVAISMTMYEMFTRNIASSSSS